MPPSRCQRPLSLSRSPWRSHRDWRAHTAPPGDCISEASMEFTAGWRWLAPPHSLPGRLRCGAAVEGVRRGGLGRRTNSTHPRLAKNGSSRLLALPTRVPQPLGELADRHAEGTSARHATHMQQRGRPTHCTLPSRCNHESNLCPSWAGAGSLTDGETRSTRRASSRCLQARAALTPAPRPDAGSTRTLTHTRTQAHTRERRERLPMCASVHQEATKRGRARAASRRLSYAG